jgi:hypothetical protein
MCGTTADSALNDPFEMVKACSEAGTRYATSVEATENLEQMVKK